MQKSCTELSENLSFDKVVTEIKKTQTPQYLLEDIIHERKKNTNKMAMAAPRSRGRGRGRGGFRGRGGRSGAFGRPLAMDGVSWSDIQKAYQPEGPLDAFPEMELPPHKRLSADQKEMTKRLIHFKVIFKETAAHMIPPIKPPAIEKYTDLVVPKPIKPLLRDIKTDIRFFPDELHSVLDPSVAVQAEARRRKTRIDINSNFDALLVAEGKEKPSDDKDDDQEPLENRVDEEEYEEENDYADNYFDDGEGDDLWDMDDRGDEEGAYYE
ncbi:hypothetical protein G9A89_013713 [Geosiphon pyriformis]|nr:hypothetical protein G9A89_013713 [Geosiphon pyriformis]